MEQTVKRDKLFSFRINSNLLEQFQQVADQNGVSVSDWLNKLAEQTVLLGRTPLQDTEEVRTELAVEEFRNQVYEGYVAMREGRYVTLEEMEKRIEQW